MELEDYTGSALVENGDRVAARDLIDRPLLVYVVDEVGPLRTKHSKTPEGDMGLLLDIMDLTNQDKYLSVLWMNKQIVDNLTRYVGKAVAIILTWKKSQTGNDYINLNQLEGEWAKNAGDWVRAQPNLFADERVKREMKTYDEIRGSKVTGMPMNTNSVPATNSALANPPVSAAAPAAAPAPVPAAAPPQAPAPAAAPQAPPTPPAAPQAPVTPAPAADDDMPF